MTKKFIRSSTTVDVEVYFDDILSEIPDETLLAELQRRQLPTKSTEVGLADVITLLHSRRFDDAELRLERIVRPKYKSLTEMMAALAERNRKVAA